MFNAFVFFVIDFAYHTYFTFYFNSSKYEICETSQTKNAYLNFPSVFSAHLFLKSVT